MYRGFEISEDCDDGVTLYWCEAIPDFDKYHDIADVEAEIESYLQAMKDEHLERMRDEAMERQLCGE